MVRSLKKMPGVSQNWDLKKTSSSTSLNWLVVSNPLKNMSSSVRMMIPKSYGKIIQSCSRKTTNQILIGIYRYIPTISIDSFHRVYVLFQESPRKPVNGLRMVYIPLNHHFPMVFPWVFPWLVHQWGSSADCIVFHRWILGIVKPGSHQLRWTSAVATPEGCDRPKTSWKHMEIW